MSPRFSRGVVKTAGVTNATRCYSRQLVAEVDLKKRFKNNVKLFLVLLALLGKGIVESRSRIKVSVVTIEKKLILRRLKVSTRKHGIRQKNVSRSTATNMASSTEEKRLVESPNPLEKEQTLLLINACYFLTPAVEILTCLS